MLFSSITFLFVFLPIVLAVYFLVPYRFKNLVMLIASLFFYAWGEPVYVILMILSICLNYVCGLDIAEKADDDRKKRNSLIFAVVVNLLLLGFFKYYGFLMESVNAVLPFDIPYRELPLPIGISFYTFQALSYIIDVYRGEVKPQKKLMYFALYISMFPQLIAGPIVRYVDIEEQLEHRFMNLTKFGQGAMYFMRGLAKKVILANTTGAVFEQIAAMHLGSYSVMTAWIGCISYAFQIYFDFGGYSDMAIGLGKMFGFEFLENFHYPYVSTSVTEFWRRWHMSLSGWFRDYVYIPLGGNRVSVLCHLRNIVIVWCLTGIWHGATWNFPVWGLYYAVILIGEKYVWKNLVSRLPGWAANTYTMLLVMFGWLIFMNTSWDAAAGMFASLLGFGASSLIDVTAGYYLKTGILLFALCVLAARPVLKKLSERFIERYTIVTVLVYLVMFLLSIGGLVFNSYQPFLYMQF